VVILTNAEEGGAFDSILYHIVDAYFGLPPIDWIAAFKAAKEHEEQAAAEVEKRQTNFRAKDSKPSLFARKVCRRLCRCVVRNRDYPCRQRQSGAELRAHTHDGGGTRTLAIRHLQDSLAECTIADAFVTFSLRPDGAIEHFKMAPVSPLADFSFDYQDVLFEPVGKK